MGRLSDFVNAFTPSRRMPLTHTCDGFHFRSVMEQSQLSPFPCDVFDERLVYFFYGRPAYRTSRHGDATSDPAFMPVCIVLSPDAITVPKRIAAFDTGAFKRKLFQSQMHPSMALADFLLEPKMDMPARLVATFYGSNEDYYWGRATTLSIGALQFEARTYYNLISSPMKTPYDDRRSSIEVQSAEALSLHAGNVLLVVLPTVFLDEPEVLDTAVKTWNPEVRTYRMHHFAPNEYVSEVYYIVEQFLRDNDYL